MQNANFPAGTVLRIRCSTYWHYGIADGYGHVIHNSKKWRRIERETEPEFSEGRRIEVSDIIGSNPRAAVRYATSKLGRTYNLFNRNCEQFVREAHGLPIECTQFQRLVVAAAGGYMTVSAPSTLIKMAGVGLFIGAVLTSSEKQPYQNAVKGAKLAVGASLILPTLLRRIL
ncbi:lecithin retinol acyltransferase family protein [Photobacterium sp. DNB22_13_2]